METHTTDTWAGVKLFFADMGLSLVLGMLLGFLSSVVFKGDAGADNFFVTTGGMVLGTLVSVYISYLAYKKYSHHTSTLVTLIGTLCVVSLISAIASFAGGATNITQQLVLLALGIVTYLFGWYVAKTTSIKLPLLSGAWVAGFMVLGILGELVSILTLVNKLFVH